MSMMNKKNIKLLLILVLAAMLLLTSCSKYEKYVVYEVGVAYDSSSNLENIAEISLEDEITEDFKSGKTKKFEIMGMEIESEYLHTENGYLYKSLIDVYKYRNDEFYITIRYNRKTNEIVHYVRREYGEYDNFDETSPSNTSTKTIDECRDIAYEKLSSFVDDPDSYTLKKELKEKITNLEDNTSVIFSYTFQYVKYIDGIETCDQVEIGISVEGEFFEYSLNNVGIVDNVKLPDEDTLEDIRNSVNESLEQKYESVKEKYATITHEEKEECLVRLKDGKYALEYKIKTRLFDNEGTGTPEITKFIVYI